MLSSWSEGLPNVLREAVTCGRPFVSTDVGSVREIADSRGGPPFAELVPVRDAGAMASAIGRALRPEFLAAAQLFPCRSWRDTADDLVSLLRRLRGDAPPTTEANEPIDGMEDALKMDRAVVLVSQTLEVSRSLEAVTV